MPPKHQHNLERIQSSEFVVCFLMPSIILKYVFFSYHSFKIASVKIVKIDFIAGIPRFHTN